MRQHPDHPQDQTCGEQRRPLVVAPEPPTSQRILEWLDSLVGGRAALLALTARPGPVPLLRDVVDPVADERWLVADELLGDLTDRLVPGELTAPLRSCLLLLRERDPHLLERTAPARITGGVAWVVGKANGTFHPDGPVRQLDVARRLGLRDLHSSCGMVRGARLPLGDPRGASLAPGLGAGAARHGAARAAGSVATGRPRRRARPRPRRPGGSRPGRPDRRPEYGERSGAGAPPVTRGGVSHGHDRDR